MVAQQLAETAHLGGALVLDAERKGLLRRLGVERLELDLRAQNLEDGAVCFPHELEPRRHGLALGASSGVVAGHRREQDRLRRLVRVQVAHERLRDVLGAHHRGGRVGVHLRHQMAEHVLEGADVDLLADNAVLDQAVLGHPALLERDADVEVLGDHLLDHRRPRAVPLGREHVMQRVERGLLLTDVQQLLRALQRVLRLGEVVRHAAAAARRGSEALRGCVPRSDGRTQRVATQVRVVAAGQGRRAARRRAARRSSACSRWAGRRRRRCAPRQPWLPRPRPPRSPRRARSAR